MEKWTTTTRVGLEGNNISYRSEEAAAKRLLEVLPKGWSVKTAWVQFMASDVLYEADHEQKVLTVVYNSNLSHWLPSMVKEVRSQMEKAPQS